MLVYRIALAKYASALKASGRAARWNPNEVEMIYTASSRSLACLENVVHRNKAGLNDNFRVMTIHIPDTIAIQTITTADLLPDWRAFNQMPYTQQLGAQWVKQGTTAILQVPSSIIDGETNYLINPLHADFGLVELVRVEAFVFDVRIKG
ncbi:MAG: RES family NAD+ phosphorylase [Mucilaginibacter sp.]|uniref:RES family NAD+ phosphorylase n=1 Tax=Mucilaginibacter sp. TaxID=1882438 RepID=UPI003267B258